jgi:hypothetical protein
MAMGGVQDKGPISGGDGADRCPQGGKHDWILTRGARVLRLWPATDTVKACAKCGAAELVEDG